MEQFTNPFDPLSYPNCYIGHQYAIDVIQGKIPNCKYIIGACRRYLKDIELKKYPFNADKAERYLRVVQQFKHVKGKGWKSEFIVYEPWQKFFFMNVMGFINPDTNERRFRTVHCEVSRGNSKSAMASQAVLYFLALDNPKGNEISCLATKSDQARIVLDSSRAMAQNSKEYLKATGVEVLAHKLVHNKSNSFARALSSDSKSLDGLNDVLCVIDELHAVDRELFDVVISGMKKRTDSLLLTITTSGFNIDGVGYSQSQYAKKIALGEHEDDTFFSLIYTIDEGDDIFIESTWRKANPNFGVSVDPVAFAATASKAKVTPSDLPNFKVKNLDICLSEAHAYFSIASLKENASYGLSIEKFYGKKCYMGIDIANKVDLTSFVLCFREEGKYYFFDHTYIPKETVEKVQSVLYDDAVAKGFLIATPGSSINLSRIEEDIHKISKKVKILASHFDPWNCVGLSQNLTNRGVNMVEFRMNVANLSEPTKSLEAAILDKKVFYNGSPVFEWCLSNVVCKEDNAGNIFPRKNSDHLKIDVAIASIMALAGWLQDIHKESVYATRPIRFF